MNSEAMKKLTLILLLFSAAISAAGQSISVENFGLQKQKMSAADLMNPAKLLQAQGDKKMATINFATEAKGLSFFADGKIPAEAAEGDGVISVKTPDKTRFILIKHDSLGQCYFKVPLKKGLRKKKVYRADLITPATGEYKLQKQWLLLKVNPAEALVYIDSSFTALRSGTLESYLPIGRHALRIEAPFYETYSDTVELTDSARVEKIIELQAFYSYISVNSGIEGSTIIAGGEIIGSGSATGRRLAPGRYRVVVAKDGLCYYDDSVSVGPAEKKVIENAGDWKPSECRADVMALLGKSDVRLSADTARLVPVSLKAADDSTEIWLNREMIAKGQWTGSLRPGFYAVSSKKGDKESGTRCFWVDEEPVAINLALPASAYGAVSVRCNVSDAEVYVNAEFRGLTPCIIQNLPIGEACELMLKKDGYKPRKIKVELKGNALVEAEAKLKKKR